MVGQEKWIGGRWEHPSLDPANDPVPMKLKLRTISATGSLASSTSQMNPSLPSGRSVIVRIRIAAVPKDRLVIMPSLPHMIRVAGCNGSDNPWHARS